MLEATECAATTLTRMPQCDFNDLQHRRVMELRMLTTLATTASIGGGSTLKVGGQNYLPSLSPPLTFSLPFLLLLLSPPFPFRPLPFPSKLEVGLLNAARGLGCAISSLVGSGAQFQPIKELVHIQGHNPALGITFLPVLLRRKFNILHTNQARYHYSLRPNK